MDIHSFIFIITEQFFVSPSFVLVNLRVSMLDRAQIRVLKSLSLSLSAGEEKKGEERRGEVSDYADAEGVLYDVQCVVTAMVKKLYKSSSVDCSVFPSEDVNFDTDCFG